MALGVRWTHKRLDGVGVGLVVLLAVWAAVFAGGGEGRPWPVILLLGGLVAATAAGRALAVRPGLVPRVVAVGVAGSLVLTWPGVLRAGGAPLGYANANATLASLGLVAALGAARTERDAFARRSWLGLAALLGAMAAVTGSTAGVLALLAPLGLLALSAVTRWAGFAIVGGLIATSLILGVTAALALGSDVGGLGDRAGVRGELWSAAIDLIREDPVAGIGAGEFADRTPVSSDPDLRWAHHGYLQVTAELGLVGFGLVAGVAAWAWASLWAAAREDPARASVTAGALAVVGLHSAVDYVWHLPPVLIVLCLLHGAGTASNPNAGGSSAKVGDDLLEGGCDPGRVDVRSTAVLLGG